MPVVRKIAIRPKPVATSTNKPAQATSLTRPRPSGVVRPGARPATSKPTSEAARRTAEGFAKGRDERARGQALQERRLARPFDFFLKPGGKARVIVLDEAPYFFHEHRWQGPEGRWDRSEVCLKDDGVPCPACTKFNREGTWIACFTVIDTTPFTIKNGKNAGTRVERSKKLWRAKGVITDKLERWYRNNGETFRGAVFDIFRSAGPKTSNSGDDFEFIERITEAQIAKYGIRDKELNKLTDYEKAFKPLDIDALNYVIGYKGGKSIGSEDLEQEPLDDEIPF